MSKEKKSRYLGSLFLTFMKIGALTFGGGYAMIPIIEAEAVEKKKWISQNEMLDILAVSESTPGPISVNSATFVGYRVGGFWGSVVATLGLVLPSFIVILIISYFYQTFLSWKIVQAAFYGLKIGVVFLLFNAFLRLKKNVKLTASSWILFLFTLLLMTTTLIVNFVPSIGGFKISLSIVCILIGLLSGVIITALSKGENKI